MDPPDTTAVAAAVVRAAARRTERFGAALSCYRLLHGYGEGVTGLEIDRYGSAAVLRYRADLEPSLTAIADALRATGDIDLVVARRRSRPQPPVAIAGTIPDDKQLAAEGPLSMWLDFGRAGNPGLYLDARSARAWLREHSEGRRVLNLFSFTGSLGISAALGGARSVTHVDSHKPTLEWAKRNARDNGLRVDDRDFARMNIYQHLRKSHAGRQRYDAVVLDPPPGPTVKRGKDRTPGARGIDYLAPLCAAMLEPGGFLLCLFQHQPERTGDDDDELASRCELTVRGRGTSGSDFPDVAGPPLRWTAMYRD